MPSSTALESKKNMRSCYGLAALNQGARLVPWAFERRELRPNDIAVKVQFCGVCHSDLHAIRGNSRFPLVPGHEMVGEVTEIGAKVTKFQVGDAVLQTLKKGGFLVTSAETPSAEKAREVGVEAAFVFCKPSAQQLAEINRLIDEGKLKTHIETVLPLQEVRRSHQLSQSGRTRGKIVLQVGA